MPQNPAVADQYLLMVTLRSVFRKHLKASAGWGWNKLVNLGSQKIKRIPIWLMTALKKGLGNPI